MGCSLIIYHLLYADDTLCFCGAEQNQFMYLSWGLMWFDAISGLRITLNQNEIMSVGSVSDVEFLASKLGCNIGKLPSSYMGLPLGAPHNSVVEVWDYIEEWFTKR